MYSFRSLLFVLLFTSFSLLVNGQDVREDFGLWSSIEVQKKLSKKWDFSAEYQYRLKDNLYQFRNNFVEIKLTRDLPNKWTTSFNFRSIAAPGEYKLRLTHIVNKSYKVSRFTFKYRLRNDFEFNIFTDDENYAAVLRNRVGVQYNYKGMPLKNAFFVEINNDYESSFLLVDRIRYKGVFKFKLSKKVDLDLAYLTQRTYHVAKPKRDYVALIGLAYEL